MVSRCPFTLTAILLAIGGCVDLTVPPQAGCSACDGGPQLGDAVQPGAVDGSQPPPTGADGALPGIDAAAGLTPAGASCRTRSDCASGHCVDGVCCQTACTETCHACNKPGAAGTCTPVAAGQDPRNQCNPTAATSCGIDGACDGRGACRRHPVGTACAAALCSAGMESSARTCDGAGACRPSTSKTCAPYLCAGNVCSQGCSGPAECVAGSACDTVSKRCSGKQPGGISCIAADQCASGFCVDGVCCSAACTGACEACNLPSARGACTPVPDDTDPGNECAADATNPCRSDGMCDGGGRCRLRAAGTDCGAATCASGTQTGARTCDGLGDCRPPQSRPCTPYLCGPTACLTACTGNNQCAAGQFCGSQQCQPKRPNSQPCNDSAQCTSGFCADGVCCENACSASAYTCSAPATPGLCRSPGLIGHWGMSEGSGNVAEDESGNDNDATLVGAFTWDTGRLGVGRSLVVNQTGHGRVPRSPSIDSITRTTGMTIAAWVYSNEGHTAPRGIVTRQPQNDSKDMFALWIRDGTRAMFSCSNATGDLDTRTATDALPVGQWRHVAATWDGTNVRLYINGALVVTEAKACDVRPSTEPLVLGGNLNGPMDPDTLSLRGRLDSVHLFNRAITAAEITELAR